MNKYILVNGYFATGASAVVDYLKEFKNTFSPDCEFRIIKEHHGIIDLDYVLNGQNDVLNEDSAFRDFLDLATKYIRNGKGFRPFGLGYENYFGKHFQELTSKYIDELTDYHYNSHWWYIDMYDDYLTYICNKIRRRIGIDDRKNKKMRFRYRDESSFLNITQNYLNSIFVELLKEKNLVSVDRIILEQVIPANQSSLAQRYFPGCKVITVDRDPRAVYAESSRCSFGAADARYKAMYLGQLAPYARSKGDLEMFVQYHLKMRKKSPKDGDHMEIRFEDFVLDRNNTREKLLEYVGLSELDHIYQRKFFKPEKSAVNIRAWEKYDDIEEEIRFIEDRLPDMLYDSN